MTYFWEREGGGIWEKSCGIENQPERQASRLRDRWTRERRIKEREKEREREKKKYQGESWKERDFKISPPYITISGNLEMEKEYRHEDGSW
jgi:hypothetical protein